MINPATRIFRVLLLILIIGGCQSGNNEKNLILKKEKMTDVMVDVHLAEAVLRNKKISGEKLDKITSDAYHKIFNKHAITKAQFDSSFAYYERNIEKFNEIYEEVIVRLNKRQRQAEQEKKDLLEEEQNEPPADK